MGSEREDVRISPEWTPSRIRADVAQRRWFHTIDLGNGILTPGHKDTPAEVVHMRLPDLSGRTVTDVGAYDGFYSSSRCERRDRRGVDRWLSGYQLP